MEIRSLGPSRVPLQRPLRKYEDMMHKSTSMLKHTWAQATADHRFQEKVHIYSILKPAMHLSLAPVSKGCRIAFLQAGPINRIPFVVPCFSQNPSERATSKSGLGRAGDPQRIIITGQLISVPSSPFSEYCRTPLRCLPEYHGSLLTVKEKRDALKIVQLHQVSTPSGKLLAPSWMWDRCRAVSTWEVVGARVGVPFCALSLFCMRHVSA